MSVRLLLSGAAALALCVPPASAQSSRVSSSTPLDAFMERVLARRDVNRKVLNDYILDEEEEFEVVGPGRIRLHRTMRDYTWFVRDGIHVRSPLRFDGVGVSDAERVRYEDDWLRRELRRRERAARAERDGRGEPKRDDRDPDEPAGAGGVPTEPRFVSEAYFMDFTFEPGNYYLAGRETFEGQDVLKIEYYPTRLFGGEDDEKTPRELKTQEGEPRRRERERELEADIERKMNKTALVTLWVDPREHQIVRYTFDNVWLDFLPAAWLVRVDAMRASMTMFQPFEGVWLPRGLEINGSATLATGSYEVSYTRRYASYRQADVQSRIRVREPQDPEENRPIEAPADPAPDGHPESSAAGPWVPATVAPVAAEAQAPPAGPAPVVREIRVHGNAVVPDAEVLRIADVAVGMPLDAGTVGAIERRLKATGHFDVIEVRIRTRSLTDPTDVALILIVHAKPGVVVNESGKVDRPVRNRITSRVLMLPILGYADGYGATYGARFSTVDLLGAGERLSVPLTWGATRRAAFEAERTFERGPVTRVLASTSIWQRENPRYRLDERRIDLRGRVERSFAGLVRAGADASRSSVDFGDLDDRMWTAGADVVLDTRGNPSFPANAVFLSADWTRLHVRPHAASEKGPADGRSINRYTLDGRGYLRLLGQSVVAGRVRYATADAPLPPYERWLIGGSDALRGFRAGAFDGDTATSSSIELRVPVTSVTSGGKLGLTVFADAARTADHGGRLADSDWQRGIGAGAFIIASVVRLNLDVARALDGGRTRVHLSTGFAF